ncbi:alpha/beta-hydrolase [Lentinula edodes]|nr:alpha/beta-hydrolase [Lentinula edodes]
MSLTRSVGLRVGPIVLGTLVKHYLEKIRRDFVQDDGSKGKEKDELVQLRQDELIYDEIFTVICVFIYESWASHPVEDIQSFSNTRTPSPPWVHVVRVRVPMSSCDEAAKYLITALGGQELAVKLVGGVKWWQVRSLDGVDAQWITAKKDWQEAKRRYKDRGNTQRDEKHEPMLDQSESATYNQDMDTMRCILYAHGGGYYFGSVDQERYSIQRYARKINGRVFAMNYRLAPQYPFPCAIQDLVASYLYLIRPPPGASHLPVKPSHIVVAGDSAGGGLILALLQVLRDASLPLPAGGILVSPWCDLTHSFPSIHTNTATDVMPPYGFSLHKPSTLWPPPDEELAGRVRTGLKQRFRAVFKGEGDPNASVLTFGTSTSEPHSNAPGNGANTDPPSSGDVPNGMPINVGATTPLPLPNSSYDHANPFDSNKSTHDSIILQAQNGEILSIQQQIQLYTTNALLGHPLVSPALGYLGGLPPLMFVISDKEVLRDEGIYVAHKAVYPEQFPIRDTTRALYPALYGIEERFKGKPTPVHLQLYDVDTAHVLPVLFSFTTPAKYCFRAMAIFCKYVTGMPLFPNNSDDAPNTPQKRTSESSPTGLLSSLSSSITSALVGSGAETGGASPPLSPRSIKSFTISGSGIVAKSALSIRRKSRKSTGSDYPIPDLKRSASEYQDTSFSVLELDMAFANAGSFAVGSSDSSSLVPEHGQDNMIDVSHLTSSPTTSMMPSPRLIPLPASSSERCAGDPIVYSETSEFPSLFDSLMIRERVSTRGVIRPLEPFSDLPAFSIPPQLIGEISERAVRRYIAGRTFFEHKFSGTRKAIEQRRRKHLQKARKDTTRNMSALKGSVERESKKMKQEEEPWSGEEEEDHHHGPRSPNSPYLSNNNSSPFNIETALLASSGWSWSWALDNNEHPPPSSLVARRDTHEALMLARVADQGVLQDEQGGGVSAAMSGNNLWSVVVGFLTPAGNGNGSGFRTGGEEHNRRERDPELSPDRRKEKPNAQSSPPSQAVSEDTEAPSTSTRNLTPSKFSSSPISSPPSKIRLLGKKPSVNALRARLASMGTSRGKSPPPPPPAAITVASSSNT